MPARLVYSPKVFAYTKDQNGTVYNLSNYVTAGQVDRKINQVSTASITLRNPYKLFTGGQGQPRAFHPMDPITIYLQKLAGYPVRVFTGYLDTTPYYQLYPGTITIQASCTLKKLLYTFFDPSLPYVIAFFEKYGWINTGSGSIISSAAFNSQATSQAQVNSGQKPFTDLRDGSLGKLLWAILYDIGEWQDANIYVENLPSGANGIASRMAALMQSIQQDQIQASSDFTTFLNAVVGAGPQGSGGGSGAATNGTTLTGSTTEAQIFNYLVQQGLSTSGAAGIIGNWKQETSNFDTGGAYDSFGLAQWSSSRHDALVKLANQMGKQDTDLAVQLAFTMQELHSSSYSSLLPTLQSTSASATITATAFCNIYEEPGAPNEMGPPVYLSKRIQYANDTFATYGSKSVGPAVASAATQAGSTAPASSTNPNPNGTLASVANLAIQAANLEKSKGVYTYTQDSGRTNNGNGVLSPPYTFDCSGFTEACYRDAGLPDPAGNTNYTGNSTAIAANCQTITKAQAVPGDVVTFGPNGDEHVAIWIGNGQVVNMGGANEPYIATLQAEIDAHSSFNGFQHLPGTTAGTFDGVTGTAAGSTTGAASSVSSNATAQAFVAELQFPSVEDQVTAIALGSEHKGLMHDQSLMPFVQQVSQASMRSFQSLPNGDFYAFYPDYFGEMGHHKPYWMIDDIEILSGGINLTDDALATHVFAVGDNTWPVNNELMNMLFSAGAINIFNAFVTTGLLDTSGTSGSANAAAGSVKGKQKYDGGLSPGVMDANEAVEFIKRYGARPLVQDYPMVRSPIFEMLLAYQQFMFAWSNQFKTPFTFTFMPELFPGGKVGFPDHGIQMYINDVSHSWDFAEGGFTTTAQLSAPSLLDGVTAQDFPDLPPLMVQALIEPIKQVLQTSTQTKQQTQTEQQGLQRLQSVIQNETGASTLTAVTDPFAPA